MHHQPAIPEDGKTRTRKRKPSGSRTLRRARTCTPHSAKSHCVASDAVDRSPRSRHGASRTARPSQSSGEDWRRAPIPPRSPSRRPATTATKPARRRNAGADEHHENPRAPNGPTDGTSGARRPARINRVRERRPPATAGARGERRRWPRPSRSSDRRRYRQGAARSAGACPRPR